MTGTSKKGLLWAMVFFLICSGCASIVSKTDYPVSIHSTPEQAAFVIKNKKGREVHRGLTPASITMKASAGFFQGESYTVVFAKEGYEEVVATLNATLDGWYVGNIIFGGLIGILIVDPATGAMWKLPDDLSVSLNETAERKNQQASLHITTLDRVPRSLRHRLVPVN